MPACSSRLLTCNCTSRKNATSVSSFINCTRSDYSLPACRVSAIAVRRLHARMSQAIAPLALKVPAARVFTIARAIASAASDCGDGNGVFVIAFRTPSMNIPTGQHTGRGHSLTTTYTNDLQTVFRLLKRMSQNILTRGVWLKGSVVKTDTQAQHGGLRVTQ